jgi:hypothetical protein
VLRKLGFEPRPQKATSHTQWVRNDDRGFFKVTLDAHLEPYSRILVGSIARQAGITVKDLYAMM